MTLKDRITQDVKDAMRARDQKKLDALRLITASIKQIEVDERTQVEEERLLIILDKMAKQRKESIAQFITANRLDLVEQEEFELNLIMDYLPTPLSQEVLDRLISETCIALGASHMADMGKIMASLKPKIQGRADMAHVSAQVKARLQ